MRKYLILFSISPFFLFNVYPQNENEIIYPDSYRFSPGDNIEWSNPDFNDSDWNEYSLGEFPFDQWQGYGWARISVKIDSSLVGIPLGMKLQFIGAVEIYVDGILAHKFGTVGKDLNSEVGLYVNENPEVAAFTFKPTEVNPDGTTTHIVAIRTSSFVVYSGILNGLPPVFSFHIGSLDDYVKEQKSINRNASIHQMFFLGVLLAFSIIHLLLYLFYRKFKPNLFFAILTFLVALLAFFRFERIFIDDMNSAIWNLRIFHFLGTLTLLAFLRFTYYLVYKKLPRSFALFSIIGLVLFVWFLISPILALDYVTILFVIIIIEIMRVIITSLIKKRTLKYKDSWIVLIGFLPFTLTSIYKLLSVLEIVPEPWDFISFPYTYYSLLVVLLSMSVFLARNFAKTNEDLEIQLEQVKSLSEKTLQQEIEKTKLEAENERKSKELDEARKLQLSMLPKKIPQSDYFEIAVYMQTATEVGGDYYDFYEDSENTLTIAIGDATGHGTQAGTMVAASKSLFISKAVNENPSDILKESSNALKKMGFSLLLMALTIAKFRKNEISISSAGMPFPLLYLKDKNTIEEIEIKGMPLGSFKDFPYQTKQFKLNSGDTLLFMSDGYPELFNDKNEMLGYNNVRGEFFKCANQNPDKIVEHLVDKGKKWSNGHPIEDDITFVVVKIK
jgi:serine phosphatase RsbU (regulator of sigma subunit)